MRNPTATTLTLLALTGTLTAGAILAQDTAPETPPASGQALAPASPVQIALPFNKAVVRESVPIKLREFPRGGYVAVSIDGRFVTAQAVPTNPRLPVYVWDTKAAYINSDDLNSPRYYNDGTHALTVVVYDAQSKPLGKDTVSVQLANKIALPSGQGIKLVYPWKTSTNLRYQRRTVLTGVLADAPEATPPQLIQLSLLRYRRTVENADGGQYLIRDEVVPIDRSAHPKPFVSYVATRGNSTPVYTFRAQYRVVDTRGRVLSSLTSQNKNNSLGFSIPVLPPRRVSVGAHWETPVQITLDWTSPNPATVTATSTLEDFEWQDRYPTAKIRETYTGPANLYPGPGSPLPPLAASDLKFERIIYFAYNAGRIVRMQTTLTLTSASPGLLSTGGGFGGGRVGSGYPGSGGGGYPGGGGFSGGYPGGGGGGFSGGYPGGGGGGYPGGGGGYPGAGGGGGGYPGAGGGGYPGGGGGGFSGFPNAGFAPDVSVDAFSNPTPPVGVGGAGGATRLAYTETSVLL